MAEIIIKSTLPEQIIEVTVAGWLRVDSTGKVYVEPF